MVSKDALERSEDKSLVIDKIIILDDYYPFWTKCYEQSYHWSSNDIETYLHLLIFFFAWSIK